MKTFILILAMLCGGIYAQSNTDNIIKESAADTSKVIQLINLQMELLYNYPDSALELAYQSLNISEQIAYEIGIIESQTNLGEIYRIQGSSDSAMYFFDHALTNSEDVGYQKGKLDALTGQGNIFRLRRNWEEANQCHLKAIEIANEESDSLQMASNYNNLGNIALDQSQLDNAIHYYQMCAELSSHDSRLKSLTLMNLGLVHFRLKNTSKANSNFLKSIEIAEAINDKQIIAANHQKIGMLKRQSNDFEEALIHYNLAIDQFKMIQDQQMVGELLSNMGNVYYDLEQYDRAIITHEKSLEIQRDIDDQISQCYTMVGIGLAYQKLKDYGNAEKYFSEAQKLGVESGAKLITMDATYYLSELYASLNQYKQAYKFAIQHKVLNDSIFNETKAGQIAEMDTKYQTSQKEKEIAALNAEKLINELTLSNKVAERNILIITTCAFFALMIVLYNRNKIKSKANAKLQELDEIKSNFFTNISHEFRTPLTLILGPLDSLLDQNPSRDNEASIQLIKRNAHRLLELINQLLDLSKLEAKQLKLELKSSNIHQFLHTQVSLFQSLAEQREIVIKIDVPQEPLELYFDTDKLQKILSNLLSNAMKFTDIGGTIEVSTAYTEKTIEIMVKDSGQGIPLDQLKHIFKRFHQLDTVHRHYGTGVGLTLVKELVELHHGTVKVQSVFGQGSQFIIALPLSMDKFEFVSSTISSKQYISQTHHLDTDQHKTVLSPNMDEEASTVLVVEDNKEVSEYITSLFADQYQVLTAVNGKEGIETAVKLIPDIIITDLMMPVMDGIELCTYLKQDERTSHIPIIMLTAKADVYSRLEGLEMGADDYMTKPFEQKELKVRMQNLIHLRDQLKTQYSRVMTLTPSQIEVTPPDQVFLEKIMKAVEDNMSDVGFTVAQLQQEMAMSRMQLHRKLKALTGLSASEFVRDQRLRRAAEILKIEGMTVAEVAYTTGFNNLSYFAKCFKEKYAISPSKFSK